MNKTIPKNILRCPNCQHGDFVFHVKTIFCKHCQKEYLRKKKKIFFSEIKNDNTTDSFDKIKLIFKNFPWLYEIIIKLVSPVYIFTLEKHIKKFIIKYCSDEKKITINLGSGNTNYADNIINIDIFPHKNVDLTCDIHFLPFKDNSIDQIINIATLEHIPSPERVVSEIHRVLKPGGVVYTYFPFIQGFHASPYDYSRKTEQGLKQLFRNFAIIEQKVTAGPASGFLWTLEEFIAILFSFGNKNLHLIINIIVMLLLFPIKFLDIILIHSPQAKNICSGFSIIARKNPS